MASSRRLLLALALGLVLLTLAAYLPVLDNGFVDYDDGQYVTANPRVQAGLTAEGVGWAMTARVARNWHPLTLLSHMLDCQLFGLDPRGHHLTSLLLHLANVVLLFAVLSAMTGAPWRSAAVAALFAVHPTHVESAAWVAERKDVLSAFFWLLAMAAYVHFARARGAGGGREPLQDGPGGGSGGGWAGGARGWYALVAVFFILGLMAKPMVVTLPFALLLLDWWPLGRLRLGAEGPGFRAQLPLVWEKLPLLALSAAASAVTLTVQAPTITSLDRLPLGARLANAVVAYVAYLGKTLVPRDLAVFYPLRNLGAGEVAESAMLLVALTAAALLAARRAPYLTFGWLWYLGVLVPVAGIVQVGAQAMADRYTYLPSIGLYVAGVWGVTAIFGRLRGSLAVARALLLVASLAALGTLVVLTRAQVATWANSTTLFRHALAVTRDNYLAHLNLANALSETADRAGGTAAGAGPLREEALAHYRAAQAIAPGSVETNAALATALIARGRPADAVPLLRAAIALDPRDARLHFDLGVALDDLGDKDSAIAELEAAVALDPAMARAHHGLGMLLLERGRTEAARVHLRTAVAADPSLRPQLEPLLRVSESEPPIR